MWWLALSLLLLCIIERGDLMDPSKVSYFNIFALSTCHVSFHSRERPVADRIWDTTSLRGRLGVRDRRPVPGNPWGAFSVLGSGAGLLPCTSAHTRPRQTKSQFNYSLSGGMHTLSKLVISVVMLRGRHRGLPVALDRAVLMPSEFLTTRSTGTDRAPPLPTLDDQLGTHEDEKNDENANSPGRENELPQIQIQQDNLNSNSKDEVAARLRLRTRTISLQIPDLGHGGYVSEMRTEVKIGRAHV